MKKKKGAAIVPDLIIIFMILSIAFAISITFLNVGKATIGATRIESVANEYLMRMESKGYLTSQDEIDLKQELKGIGVENIDLTGTTRADIGYAKTIYLKIKGDYKIKVLDMEGEDRGNKPESTPVDITRQSVSKN